MLIQNNSVSRTIVHNDGDQIYRIDPLGTLNVPEEVAESILTGWAVAAPVTEEKPNLPKVPWEHKCGEVWKKAKMEFGLTEEVKETVGAARPEVEEPVNVADITGDKNKNICPSCAQEFPTLKGVRLHQRRLHKS